MDTTSPLSHEALLTLARKLEAAASDDDHDRVEAAARRLFEALVDHFRAEQPEIARLQPERRLELAGGQQQLVDHLVEIGVDAQDEDLLHCVVLAQRLIAELSLQADDERRSGLVAAAL